MKQCALGTKNNHISFLLFTRKDSCTPNQIQEPITNTCIDINYKKEMVSIEDSEPLADSSPRISFSSDFLDDADFISISPEKDKYSGIMKNPDFEFLSSKSLNCSSTTMLSADELIFEGKLLPFTHQAAEKLKKINLKSSENDTEDDEDEQKKARKAVNLMMGNKMEEPRIWYIDDDPSPRPPKCTVLWKELLRLRKSRHVPASSSSSSLSPSSSSSSSSSSMGDHMAAMDEGEKSGLSTKEKHLRRIKKGLERTRSSTSIRIRPMVNVPICTQVKSTSLPPLFPPRKSRVTER